MRIIKGLPVIIFTFFFCSSIFLAVSSSIWILDLTPGHSFSSLLAVFLGLSTYLFSSVVFYRIYFRRSKLFYGVIEKESPEECRAMVYQLFFLLIWRPILKSNLIPVPLTRIVMILLGAKVGKGSYFGGHVGDPQFLIVGEGSLLGEDAMIISHVIEAGVFEYHNVEIGNNVTIGAKSILLPGVKIGDGAMIAAGSVVQKHTVIPPGEVWGGTPAKKLR